EAEEEEDERRSQEGREKNADGGENDDFLEDADGFDDEFDEEEELGYEEKIEGIGDGEEQVNLEDREREDRMFEEEGEMEEDRRRWMKNEPLIGAIAFGKLEHASFGLLFLRLSF
ncbi:hypothetical protein T265_16329, partial [Opisthorchis viverrini]